MSISHNQTAFADKAKLFRYKNDQDILVVDYSVPPQFVHKGYVVTDENGRVLEIVAPTYDDPELAAQQARERAVKEEEERLRRWDESLLQKYSTVDDINAALDRKVREIKVRLAILKANISGLKGKLEDQQGQAAEMERKGWEVPEALAINITALLKEIAVSEEMAQKHQQEKVELVDKFQKDIARFEQIIGQAKLRQETYRVQ